MAWSVGAEPIPSSIISRRRRQPGSSRWPRQSNGMWAAPPSDHFREIDWSVPSRWKTLRTSDELLHSRQLADGGRTCRRAKSARRAKLEQHTERPMYVSKSPAETWEGLLRTHRRTARLSIWLVHFGPWTTRRKLLCIARTPSRWARGPAQQRKRSILLDSRRIKQRSARPSRQTALTSLLRRAALSAAP